MSEDIQGSTGNPAPVASAPLQQQTGQFGLALPPLPPWVYLAAVLLGVPLTGMGGSMLGAQQIAADVARLEIAVTDLAKKNERLNDSVIELRIAVIRLHANDAGSLVVDHMRD